MDAYFAELELEPHVMSTCYVNVPEGMLHEDQLWGRPKDVHLCILVEKMQQVVNHFDFFHSL